MNDNLTKARTRAAKGKAKLIMAAMNDNLTKARTRAAKGKAKLIMATKKDDGTKARTCVTKGISVGKNHYNLSTFKGKNDFSKAIGAGEEVLVNPSSLDVPKESCESNIPYSEDEMTEILIRFQGHELCCLNQRTMILPTMSWLTERKSPSPPPPESVAVMNDILTKARTRAAKGKAKLIMAAMNDNLTKARTRAAKGKAKLIMATKKDDVTKTRTCVTKGISVGKNQCNLSTFKGKNDFSKAIGAGKEVLVNPSSLDVPKESCESNIPYLEDEITEILRESNMPYSEDEITEILREFQGLTEHKSPSPPPPESAFGTKRGT